MTWKPGRSGTGRRTSLAMLRSLRAMRRAACVLVPGSGHPQAEAVHHQHRPVRAPPARISWKSEWAWLWYHQSWAANHTNPGWSLRRGSRPLPDTSGHWPPSARCRWCRGPAVTHMGAVGSTHFSGRPHPAYRKVGVPDASHRTAYAPGSTLRGDAAGGRDRRGAGHDEHEQRGRHRRRTLRAVRGRPPAGGRGGLPHLRSPARHLALGDAPRNAPEVRRLRLEPLGTRPGVDARRLLRRPRPALPPDRPPGAARALRRLRDGLPASTRPGARADQRPLRRAGRPAVPDLPGHGRGARGEAGRRRDRHHPLRRGAAAAGPPAGRAASRTPARTTTWRASPASGWPSWARARPPSSSR